MLGDGLLDGRVRKHREHELALDRSERIEQSRKISLVERTVVVPAVAADIGRVDEMERTLAVVAFDEIDAVLALDRNAVEALA